MKITTLAHLAAVRNRLMGALYLMAANERRTIASKQRELCCNSLQALLDSWAGEQAEDYLAQSSALGLQSCFNRYSRSHPNHFRA
jgi:hypothetical protein